MKESDAGKVQLERKFVLTGTGYGVMPWDAQQVQPTQNKQALKVIGICAASSVSEALNVLKQICPHNAFQIPKRLTEGRQTVLIQ